MPKNNSKSQRDFRKDQAEARAAERRGRTNTEQLAVLDTRPGNAAKEREALA
jgi:hypothetical protein